jgi:hypothetical protein
MTSTSPFAYRKNPLQRLFDWKVRGVRWVELIGVALVAVMIMSVYVAKAAAARESARIAELERDIRENGQRVRLLKAEAARLEQPARLEALSRQMGLGPVDVHKQADADDLPELKVEATPAAAPARAPAPAPAAPAAALDGEPAQ